MYSTITLAALVASAAAQAGYGYGAPSYESPSAPAYETTSAPAYETPSAPAYSAPSAPAYQNATWTTSATPTGYGSASTTEAPTWYHSSNGTATAPAYVTIVTTSFETYCPSATTYTYECGAGPQTITVSSATTLTVTKCPGGCHVPTPVASCPPTVTAIVSQYTTFCPTSTVMTWGPSTSPVTSTISQPTTVTISQCPGGCTVTAPVSAITPPAYTSPAYTPPATTAAGNATTSAITPYTGGAGKMAGSGVGALALIAGAMLF